MRILFLGDIVGTPGVKMVQHAVPLLIERERLSLVVVNAENAAGGSGLTARLYRRLRAAGVDLVTLGDHIYRKAEIIPTLQEEERLCKPANFPPDAPGRDYAFARARDQEPVAVISLLGRTFMRNVDCPFRAADRVLESLDDSIRIRLVDIHAEATADKYLIGHHLKGRVTAVMGTHTHVPTADEHLMEGGTAFICDVGMCGPHKSILGRRVDRVLSTTIDFVPTSFQVASEDVRLNGVILEVENETGQALSIRRITVHESNLTQWQHDPHIDEA